MQKVQKRRVKACFNKTNYVFEFDHSKNIVSFYPWFYYIQLSRVDIYISKWKIAYIKDFLYIN